MLIRDAKLEDCSQLLQLMHGLAEFEGYLDDFKVTLADLQQRGFPTNGEAEFAAIVADDGTQLRGMVVYYLIPFTYDLRPTLFLKEVYVDASARNQRVGEKLFAATIRRAKQLGCGRIKWDVLASNTAAQRFYQRQGGQPDRRWQGYVLALEG